jgi:5-methylcytosine-specific restriction endonuclease McrA
MSTDSVSARRSSEQDNECASVRIGAQNETQTDGNANVQEPTEIAENISAPGGNRTLTPDNRATDFKSVDVRLYRTPKWRLEKFQKRPSAPSAAKLRAKERARNRKRRRDPAFRASEKAYLRDYYQRNKDKMKLAAREWAQANPEQRTTIRTLADNRRRAACAQAGSSQSQHYRAFVEYVRTVKKLGCYWCNRATRKKDRHIDHIVPLSKGGLDVVTNLCCSCTACNLSKQAKLPEEFTGQYVLAFTTIRRAASSRPSRVEGAGR